MAFRQGQDADSSQHFRSQSTKFGRGTVKGVRQMCDERWMCQDFTESRLNRNLITVIEDISSQAYLGVEQSAQALDELEQYGVLNLGELLPLATFADQARQKVTEDNHPRLRLDEVFDPRKVSRREMDP